MKHALKITLLLIAMFLITQTIGIFVVAHYSPQTIEIKNPDGTMSQLTTYNLPYGMDPPQEVEQKSVGSIASSFVIIFAIAVGLMLILMKFNADLLIRGWFFVVVLLAVGISVNSFISQLPSASIISLVIALPLGYFKIFKRNLLVHNITELIIYPGIAAIFVALLLSWTSSPILAVSIILILISFYDMYAVWHSGFMQRMAQYQITNLKLFTGFFIPYIGKKQRQALQKSSKLKKKKQKSVKISVAILGGGDVVFPIILAGVVLNIFGLLPALIISLGATLALSGLFWLSEKGKFYPAMPFISVGCFAALGIIYLL